MKLLREYFKDDITYVTGHKNPDADSVGSSIALACLLNRLGIKALAVTGGKINRETAFFLKYFDLKVPETIDHVKERQFVLVDHSSYTQAIDDMSEADIVALIDHHVPGDMIENNIPLSWFTDYAATATMIYQLFIEHQIKIDKDIARVLLMAIVSDSKNLKKQNVKDEDRKAYNALLKISQIDNIDEIYNGMIKASTTYEGMSDLEILEADYKEYEFADKRFGIALASCQDSEEMLSLASRMYKALKENFDDYHLDYAFIKVSDQSNRMCMYAYPEQGEKILEKIYGKNDHEYFLFDKNLSRKLEIVPAIEEYLKRKQQ